jgi:CubicO group peptidase (beta-lactamase class C family)
MTSTYCTGREAIAAADHATPHYLALDKSIRPIDWDNLDSARGAGSINSTARDLAKWLRFQLAGGKLGDKRILSEKTLKETRTPQMLVRQEGRWAVLFPPKQTKFLTYGLGWFVSDYRGHVAVSHGGTLTGFRAQCMMVPEKNVGVFVLCNLRPSGLTEAVAKSVLDHFLGLPPEDWVKYHRDAQAKDDAEVLEKRKKREANRKPDTKPSRDLSAYAGVYEEPAYGKLSVEADNGRLTLHWGKYTYRLDHYHFDTFTGVPIAPAEDVFRHDRDTFDIQFRLGKDGEVEAVTFLDQDFRRERPKKP